MIPRHFNVSQSAVYGKNAQAFGRTYIGRIILNMADVSAAHILDASYANRVLLALLFAICFGVTEDSLCKDLH